MKLRTAVAFLMLGLVLALLLPGCPGMPGAPGGAGASAEKMPPGLTPPPGLTSGGVRTLMGVTITPPEDSILLVKWAYAGEPIPTDWQACRRVSSLDNALVMEGLNFDGRDPKAEKDLNRILPYSGLTTFYWKYELKPVPKPVGKPTAGPRSGPVRRGR
jgi:hypothetical protein